MINITEAQYKKWQDQLRGSQNFRNFWVFWSNYSLVLFVVAFLIAFQVVHIAQILVLAPVSFVVARGVVVPLINRWYKRPRPYQNFHFEPITTWLFSWKTADPNSFPSRHVTSFAAVTGAFLIFAPALGAALLVVTILTGVARVVLGFHYPKDVIGGFFIGLAIAAVCYILVLNPVL
jgi:membrane-associated phospholipid phosphatase